MQEKERRYNRNLQLLFLLNTVNASYVSSSLTSTSGAALRCEGLAVGERGKEVREWTGWARAPAQGPHSRGRIRASRGTCCTLQTRSVRTGCPTKVEQEIYKYTATDRWKCSGLKRYDIQTQAHKKYRWWALVEGDGHIWRRSAYHLPEISRIARGTTELLAAL